MYVCKYRSNNNNATKGRGSNVAFSITTALNCLIISVTFNMYQTRQPMAYFKIQLIVDIAKYVCWAGKN